MSSIESASLQGPDVGEKTSVDFGAKAVCLKSQSESSRLIQSGNQNRNVSQTSIRPSVGVATSHQNMPVHSNVSSGKTAFSKAPTSTVQTASSGSRSSLGVGCTLPTSALHVTSYHVPRGPAQVANIASRPTSTAVGRPSVTMQPVGVSPAISSTSGFTTGLKTSTPSTISTRAPSPMGQITWGTNQPVTSMNSNNVLMVPRCISPSSVHPRTAGPRTTATTGTSAKGSGVPRAADTTRPLLIQKPVTITQATQLHIGHDKTIKVPPGSVAQMIPLRPPYTTGAGPSFIAPSQATVLQTAVSTNTVLTTPMRLNVSSSQPPLLSSQRVSVSATPGTVSTVLASRIAVSSVAPVVPQTVTLGGQARIPSGMAQNTIIATSNRLVNSTQGTTVLSAPARLALQAVTGQNSIPLAPARISTYPAGQVMTGQPAVLSAATRITSAGTTVMPAGKSTPRVPVTSATTSTTTRITSATATTTAKFVSTARGTSTPAVTLCTANPQGARLAATPGGATPIVVQPQIMVTTSVKAVVHGGNHLTQARPLQIHNSTGQKVITQSIHGPIQITQSPVNTSIASKTSSQAVPQSLAHTTITTVSSKQMCYTPTTSLTTRPVAVVASQSIPMAKIFPQNNASSGSDSEGSVAAALPAQSPSVFIQASHRTITSPGLVCTQQALPPDSSAPTLSTYTLPSGTSYIYEAPRGYQLATDAPLVARPLSPEATLVSRHLSSDGPLIARPFTPGNGAYVSQPSTAAIRTASLPTHGLITTTAPPVRFNPVMIVDSGQTTFNPENSTLLISDSSMMHQGVGASKLTSSPRPSILRKRDNEPSPTKAVKNLTPMLSSASVSRSASPSPPSLHLETNQQSNDHGPSSNGSTTISATSSPGLDDHADSSSMPAIKNDFNDDSDRPPVEMSPRKKPRKQLLNDANDTIEMEFISEDRMKKEREEREEEEEEEPTEKVYLKMMKKPNLSIMHAYRQNWRSRHNHFNRYSDVKAREERRPTVTELASQKHVMQMVNGWKVFHFGAQMEDMSQMESHVVDRLSAMLQVMDKTICKDLEKEVNRVNDLIMGNIQRSKVIKDQMQEARAQLLKVCDHKVHVAEIITRCASKRNFKKREKY